MYKRSFLKRSFLKIILMSLMFMSCTIIPSEAVYTAPWNGFTSTKPPQVDGVYIITTGEHLAWLALIIIVETKVRFDANIDMNNKNFDGIKHFKGTMDGNGHSIKNLKIDNPTGNAGLIHVLTGDGSEIKNLTIENGSIKGEKDVGAFVGTSKGSVTLTGLTNKASVESLMGSASGIIAVTDLLSPSTITIIKDVKNFGAITGNPYGGGIIARTTTELMIDNVENAGTINSQTFTGGIVGYVTKTVNIKNAANTGNISVNATSNIGHVGGMIGQAAPIGTVNIENAENSGNISVTGTTSTSTLTGGMIGSFVGGITGFVRINKANNSGNISSTSAGGMIGRAVITDDAVIPNIVDIENANNSGNISSTVGAGIGGMIGHTESKNRVTIINTSHSYKVQVLVAIGLATINNSYFLKSTPGDTTLTAEQFKEQDSFEGWDFNTIWKMGDNYPVLR